MESVFEKKCAADRREPWGETAGHDVLHYFVLADKSSFALELGRIAHSDSMPLGVTAAQLPAAQLVVQNRLLKWGESVIVTVRHNTWMQHRFSGSSRLDNCIEIDRKYALATPNALQDELFYFTFSCN